jgi:hypothetical protein
MATDMELQQTAFAETGRTVAERSPEKGGSIPSSILRRAFELQEYFAKRRSRLPRQLRLLARSLWF